MISGANGVEILRNIVVPNQLVARSPCWKSRHARHRLLPSKTVGLIRIPAVVLQTLRSNPPVDDKVVVGLAAMLRKADTARQNT
jgi:hypothetical protein